MPGQPVRAHARFQFSPGNSPSRIASLPPASPTFIIRQAETIATYSLNPLWSRMLRPAIEKHSALVNKLWTIGLACGSLRKNPHESWPDN